MSTSLATLAPVIAFELIACRSERVAAKLMTAAPNCAVFALKTAFVHVFNIDIQDAGPWLVLTLRRQRFAAGLQRGS